MDGNVLLRRAKPTMEVRSYGILQEDPRAIWPRIQLFTDWQTSRLRPSNSQKSCQWMQEEGNPAHAMETAGRDPTTRPITQRDKGEIGVSANGLQMDAR